MVSFCQATTFQKLLRIQRQYFWPFRMQRDIGHIPVRMANIGVWLDVPKASTAILFCKGDISYVYCAPIQQHNPNQKTMANICKITGKRVLTGNRVSKANNKTKRKFNPNIQHKKHFCPELNAWIKLPVCAKAMRTINKNGLYQTLKKALKKGTLAPEIAGLVAVI